MKKIYNIFFTAIAALAFLPMANAQHTIKDVIGYELEFPKADDNFDTDKSVGFSKQIAKPVGDDGTYWIKLETYATGSASTAVTPADIVLVLDLSSSMRNNYVQYTYESYRPRNGWTYSTGYTSTQSNNYAIYCYEYNGVYCVVDHIRIYDSTGTESGTGAAHYALTFRDDKGTRHYLLNNTVYDSWADVPKTAANDYQGDDLMGGASLLRGNRDTGVSDQRRIDALRRAVKNFIDVIDKYDKYDDEAGTHLRPGGRAGNRISMITFWSNANLVNSLAQGKMADASSQDPTRSTAQYLKNLVDAFPEDNSGTRADLGINIANQQLASINRESNKFVVVFTDGEPYPNNTSTQHPYGENYDTAISALNTSKNTYDATVFTVGLFSSTPWDPDNLWKFMNYMSSNAPSASSMTSPGSDFDKDAGYYKDASSSAADLESIFEDIAHQVGGAGNPGLSSATSNVDIIAASFKLPDNATASNIKVFTAKCNKFEDGVYSFDTEVEKGYSNDKYDVYDERGFWTGQEFVDRGINVVLDPDDQKITVTGFDYSNNWCGYKDGSIIHGHKIIIMIPIQMNPDAVGGPNVATNVEGSGLYLPGQDPEKDDPEVAFNIPQVSLPVNLYIEKAGLGDGESAKFVIQRAMLGTDPDDWDWEPGDFEESDWEYVTTVFVTQGANSKTNPETSNPWVKVRALPATIPVDANNDGKPDVDGEGNQIQQGIAYRIVEENWSWSYKLDETIVGNDKEQYTVPGRVDNPFKFTNKTVDERIDVTVRHAESKVTNHFTDKLTTKEVYDDSKDNGR